LAGKNLESAREPPFAAPHLKRGPAASLAPDLARASAILKRYQRRPRLPVFEHHVFVCHNSRPADAPRPSCTTDGKSDLHARLQQLTKEAGLAGRVRINKSGCLDQCEHGPTVVVYPEAVWYGGVRLEDAAEIVAEHLVGGRPVERLRIADECLNTKSCPHRS
jgi:(2Fe-2S) ferredoxin